MVHNGVKFCSNFLKYKDHHSANAPLPSFYYPKLGLLYILYITILLLFQVVNLRDILTFLANNLIFLGSDQKQEIILHILCLFSVNYRFN